MACHPGAPVDDKELVMHARSTTITGDPGAVDAAVAFVRDEVMPSLTAMDGCLGLSLVADRELGRIIATSSWRDEEAMHAADQHLGPMRAEGGKILGGSPQVEEWEVAVMHRDHATHEGSCCRITWARTDDVEQMARTWRERILPGVEQFQGFCSASLLVDRSTGRGCATVVFDDHRALEATRDQAAAMRRRATDEMGLEILAVGELDLEIAHLRLPELV